MEKELDLVLYSSMIGRAIEDIVYRQLEDLQRQGTLSEEGLKWLRNISSPVDENGNQQIPINFDRIDKDLRVLIQIKEQLDKYLGIDTSYDEDDVKTGPSV